MEKPKVFNPNQLGQMANPIATKKGTEFEGFNEILKTANQFGATLLSLLDKYNQIKKVTDPKKEQTGEIANKFEKGKAQGHEEAVAKMGNTVPRGANHHDSQEKQGNYIVKINEEQVGAQFKEFAMTLVGNLDKSEGIKEFKEKIKDDKKTLKLFNEGMEKSKKDIEEQIENPMLRMAIVDFIEKNTEVGQE